jgi:transposase
MDEFKLSSKELAILQIAHREAKQKRYADRIKAIYLLGTGWTLAEVAEALMLSDESIRNYWKRYESGKLEGLLRDDYQGNEGRLTESELGMLDEHLLETTYRTVKEIIYYVEEDLRKVIRSVG